MIELLDTLADTNVQPAEYKRLLGYPADHVLTGPARQLADAARQWYAKNGRPWVYGRAANSVQIVNGSIVIDGVCFASKRLGTLLQQAGADGAVLVAVSAGPEIEQEAQRAWREERPDEYFFLETFGSAVVEHLVTTTGARLCAWAEGHSLAVLPHYSPGYPDWDIAQQSRLLELIRNEGSAPLPAALEVLDSGMLRPKKSLLAVFGLTRQMDRARRLTDLVPCENCSFAPCQFRRTAYRRAVPISTREIATAETGDDATPPAPPPPALDRDAKYATNSKALQRWAEQRLTLTDGDDGTIDALFRYEGTTCSNMGRALLFNYRLKLGPASSGYTILEQKCEPAPGHDGYTFMCRYMANAEHLMVAIDHEKPLLGRSLNDVLSWDRPRIGAGCYCEPGSRKHKWGLVLETIHYALVEREKNLSQTAEEAQST